MFAITVWYIDKPVFQLCLRNRTKIDVYAGIIIYLHSPVISLDEPILDRRGSYIHERPSFTRRYA